MSYLKTVRVAVILLAALMAFELPAIGQGRGRGHGHERGGIVIVDRSSRGRGRNWNPRTRRGRWTRAIIRRNNANPYPGIPRRRRVRRGYRVRHIMP